MRAPLTTLILATSLTACAVDRPLTAPLSMDWRTAASQADRDRLHDWRKSFTDALADARTAGFGAQIDSEGPLLQPDSALGGALPWGNYRCRTIKLGALTPSNRHFVAYPFVPCELTSVGKARWFEISTGVQRPAGFVYPGDRLRGVFLGALSLGDEKVSMRYGVDPDRDMIGWVERIGDARWRIILPKPTLESRTDIIELVPAGR